MPFATQLAPTSVSDPKLKVFISYARSDLATTDRLVKALEAGGLECLVDRRDLPYGEKWQNVLREFIRAADAVVFLVSPRSIISQWCRWELTEITKHSKRLVPIVVEAVPPEHLPPEIGSVHLMPFGPEVDFEAQSQTLQTVLLTDRVWVREHTRLLALALKWAEGGERRDVLLRGAELADAETWKAQPRRSDHFAIAPAVEAFISDSRAHAIRSQRLRIRFAAVVAMGALAISGIAVWQWWQASVQRDYAEQQQIIAVRNQRIAEEQKTSALKNEKIAKEQRNVALATRAKLIAQSARDQLKRHSAEIAVLLALESLPDDYFKTTSESMVESVLYTGLLSSRVIARFGLNDGAPLTPRPDLMGFINDPYDAISEGAEIFLSAATCGGRREVFAGTSRGRILQVPVQATGSTWIKSNHGPPIHSLHCSEDGTTLLFSSSNAQFARHAPKKSAIVGTINIATRSTEATQVQLAADPVCAKFVAQGEGAILTLKGDIVLFALHDGRIRRVFSTGMAVATQRDIRENCIWPRTDKNVIVVLAGGNVAAFDLQGRKKYELRGHVAPIFSLHIDRAGEYMFTAHGSENIGTEDEAKDVGIRKWDLSTGKLRKVVRGFERSVYGVTSTEGQLFAVSNGYLHIRDEKDSGGEKVALARPTSSNYFESAYFRVLAQPTDQGGLLVALGLTDVVVLMSRQRGEPKRLRRTPGSQVWPIGDVNKSRICEFGQIVFACSVASREPACSFRGVATEKETGRTVTVYRDHKGRWIYFSLDEWGHKLQVRTSSSGTTVSMSDEVVAELNGHSDHITCLVIMPDLRRVITGAGGPTGRSVTERWDDTVRIWELDTGKQLLVMRGHTGPLTSLALSEDGRYLVTTAEGDGWRLWDTSKGEQLAEGGVGLAIRSAVLTMDGSKIVGVTGSADDIRSQAFEWARFKGLDQLAAAARESIPRCLTLFERRQFNLDTDPPRWCFTGPAQISQADSAKWRPMWPFQAPEWKSWLEEKERGGTNPMPLK